MATGQCVHLGDLWGLPSLTGWDPQAAVLPWGSEERLTPKAGADMQAGLFLHCLAPGGRVVGADSGMSWLLGCRQDRTRRDSASPQA